MLRKIKRSLKVSHSSCTKVIELCLEIVDSIPKPLQRIWLHSKGTLGFRLWSHHYPSHCSHLVASRRGEIRPFPKNSLGLVTLSGGCGLTRRSGAAKGKGGKRIIKIRKLNLRRLRRRENAVQRTPPRAHQPWPDYGIYNVLNWNAEDGESSAFQCTTY